VLLYWNIGREILQRQASEGWGKNVIPRLSKDLSAEFPEMKDLSPRNLGYMKAFAEAWPDDTILQQLAAKLPWFHRGLLLHLRQFLIELEHRSDSLQRKGRPRCRIRSSRHQQAAWDFRVSAPGETSGAA
jgi:hypothetical protein